MARPPGPRLAGLALAALLAAAPPAHAAPLTEREAAGKRIYLDGVSPSGREITARIGAAASVLPGHVLPCGNCHGTDGLGKPEAGVLPPPITWSELAKSYGHSHEGGRRHPPFDEASFARSLTMGIDPAGNRLETAMPRYELHPEDLESLFAYIRRLEHDLDPGLTEKSIRVGTVLPDAGPGASAGEAMRKAIEAVFAEANAAGGIYGRRLELVSRPAAPRPGGSVEAARALVEKEGVFALLSPFALSAEGPLAELAEEKRIPVVGPFTVRGPAGPGGRYTFYLFSGVAEQAEVLVAFGLERARLRSDRLAIVYPEEAVAAADAAEARCRLKGCAEGVRMAYRPDAFDAERAAAAARKAGAGAVLFLGNAAELEQFAQAAARASWFPQLLAPGPLGGRAASRLPAGFAGRLYLAYPTSPDRQPDADQGFARYAARQGLTPGQALPAFSGYLAASLFVDALRRSGQALGRERLVATLETTSDYQGGLAQPLRYGPQRRIGALGGHIVTPSADGAGLAPASGWIALD